MQSDFSATASQKTTTGSTPFDQIATLEKQEAARVKKETDAFTSEKAEVEKAVAEKQTHAEQELRDEAKNELKQYKEAELNTILAHARREAEKEADKLESTYESSAQSVISDLVNSVTETNFSLSA